MWQTRKKFSTILFLQGGNICFISVTLSGDKIMIEPSKVNFIAVSPRYLRFVYATKNMLIISLALVNDRNSNYAETETEICPNSYRNLYRNWNLGLFYMYKSKQKKLLFTKTFWQRMKLFDCSCLQISWTENLSTVGVSTLQ